MTHSCNRREFIASAVALGAAGAIPLTSIGKGDDKRYGDFTVGVQSFCFRNFNTEQCLKRIQELGLHYVEFYNKHAPREATPEQIKALLRLCRDYGVMPVSWGVQPFSNDHDDNKKSFEFAKALGAKHISADPSPDSFDSLDKLCEEYKITVAIHPHGPSGGGKLHRWYSAQIIMDAVKDHHPLIGTCIDTGHTIRAQQLGPVLDPAQEVRIMGARNFGMHLKDHDNEKREDVIYGKGRLNVVEVLKALKEVNFNGYIAVEYEAHPENPSPDIAACLEILRNAVKTVG